MKYIRYVCAGLLWLTYSMVSHAQTDKTVTHVGSAAIDETISFDGEQVRFQGTVGGLIGDQAYTPFIGGEGDAVSVVNKNCRFFT